MCVCLENPFFPRREHRLHTRTIEKKVSRRKCVVKEGRRTSNEKKHFLREESRRVFPSVQKQEGKL